VTKVIEHGCVSADHFDFIASASLQSQLAGVLAAFVFVGILLFLQCTVYQCHANGPASSESGADGSQAYLLKTLS
jgi:hypothetical protein